MSTQVSEQQARQVAEDAREQDWRLPSFGKELFLGNFRLDLIHPSQERGNALRCCRPIFLAHSKGRSADSDWNHLDPRAIGQVRRSIQLDLAILDSALQSIPLRFFWSAAL